jgi:hypothetical protein
MDTQKQRVLELLQKKPQGAFTYDFFDLNPPIIRPAARIEELRKEGHLIETVRVSEGNFKYILKQKYEVLSQEELIDKQKVAEDWLRDNESHPKYEEALKRYEDICDQITLKLLI